MKSWMRSEQENGHEWIYLRTKAAASELNVYFMSRGVGLDSYFVQSNYKRQKPDSSEVSGSSTKKHQRTRFLFTALTFITISLQTENQINTSSAVCLSLQGGWNTAVWKCVHRNCLLHLKINYNTITLSQIISR